MILYHFTCIEYVEAILNEGLNRGDVPTSRLDGVNGVWFTTDSRPIGHGIGSGGYLTDEDRRAYFAWRGVLPPPGARNGNKRAVRISVVIPSTDRLLVQWSKWGRKHCERNFFDALNKAGKFKTWFIYFGTVAPNLFREVKYLIDSPDSVTDYGDG